MHSRSIVCLCSLPLIIKPILGGLDYEEFRDIVTTVEFTFPNGNRKRRFNSQHCNTVSILSDDIVENDEYFELMLNTADPDVILSPSNANVVILNNDCKCCSAYQ